MLKASLSGSKIFTSYYIEREVFNMNKMNKVFTTIYTGSLALIGATIASCYYKDSPLEEGVNKFVGKVKKTFSNKE